jgi:hypothetical protein
MAGLLNTLKKNWRGLLDEVQAAPESLRALTQPAAAQQFDAALRKGGTIDKEKAVQMAMDVLQTTPMGVMGKIVYHGSPHKFDKFDMSKIGTGEGAQAYGHGLYFAETPEVAMQYHKNLTRTKPGSLNVNGEQLSNSDPRAWVAALLQSGDDASVRATIGKVFAGNDVRKRELLDALDSIRGLRTSYEPPGALYKVDIPDEAIPRMLDWDKPLRMQPEAYRQQLLELAKQKGILDPNGSPEGVLGKGLYEGFGDGLNSPQTAEQLKALGVPGIRYLDGGSRTAGEGTSNFVLFDDQLPRILERNGIPTGLNTWAPGEWRGLLEP